MEPIQKATSGADASTSGLADNKVPTSNNVDPVKSGDPADKTYPAEFVSKMKQEKLNQAKQIKELAQQLDDLKGLQVKEQEDKLAKKEQYKTLWEQEKEKSSNLEQDFSELKTQITETKKKQVVREQLMRLGLNSEHEATAFRLMDLSSVIVDDDTGALVGAEEAAKDFYENFKTLGLFGKKMPGVSHEAPVIGTSVSKPASEMSSKELQEELTRVMRGN